MEGLSEGRKVMGFTFEAPWEARVLKRIRSHLGSSNSSKMAG